MNKCSMIRSSGTPADGAGLGSAQSIRRVPAPPPAGPVSDLSSTELPLRSPAPVDQGPGASPTPKSQLRAPRTRVSRSIPPAQPTTFTPKKNAAPFASSPLRPTVVSPLPRGRLPLYVAGGLGGGRAGGKATRSRNDPRRTTEREPSPRIGSGQGEGRNPPNTPPPTPGTPSAQFFFVLPVHLGLPRIYLVILGNSWQFLAKLADRFEPRMDLAL